MTPISRFTDPGDLTKVSLLGEARIRAVPRVGAMIFDAAAEVRRVREYRPFEGSFDAVSAWIVKGATLCEGYVVRKNGRIYLDGSIDTGAFRGAREAQVATQFDALLGTELRVPDLRYADRQALVMHNEGGGTWGHFLIQNLPRAILYAEAFSEGGLAMPADQCLPASPFAQALEAAGIDRSRLLPLVGGVDYVFGELAFVDPVYNFDLHLAHPFAIDRLAHMGERVASAPGEHSFFVERVGGGTGRRIENAGDVADVMSRRGFAVRRLGETSLFRQIASWRGAERVAAVLGSDLTNMVFARRQADIIALSPDWFGDAFFYHLAAVKGVRWHELRCGVRMEEAEISHRSSFAVDVELLDVLLGSL